MATANPTVTVNILGDGSNLASTLSQVQGTLQKFTQDAANAGNGGGGGGIFGGLLGGAGKLLGPLAAVAAGFVGVQKSMQFMTEGIGLNAEIEQSKTGLATLMGMFGDDRGFGDRLAAAGVVMDELRDKGLEASATFMELQGALTMNAGVAASAGVTDFSDQIDLLVASSNALATLGGSQDRLAAEFGRMMQGTLKADDKLSILFKGSEEELKKAVKEGNAMQFIMEKMGPVIKDAGEGMNTWESQMTMLTENWQNLQAEVMEPIFDALKPGLQWLNDKLSEAVEIVKNIKTMFETAFEANGVQGVVDLLWTGVVFAFKAGVNALFAGVNGVFAAIAAGVNATFGLVAQGSFWLGLLGVFQGLGNILIGAIGVVIAKLTLGLQDALDPFREKIIAAVVFVGDLLKTAFTGVGLILKQAFLSAAVALLNAIEPMAKKLGFGGAVERVREATEQEQVNTKLAQDENSYKAATMFSAPPGEESGWDRAMNTAKNITAIQRGAAEGVLQDAQDRLAKGVKDLQTGAGTLAPMLADATGAVTGAFADAYNKSEDVMDTTAEQKKLQEAYDKAKAVNEQGKKDGAKPQKLMVPGADAGADANKDKQGKGGGEQVDSFQAIGGGGGFFAATGTTAYVQGFTGKAEKTPEEKNEEYQTSMIAILTEQRELLKEIAANTAGGKSGGGGLTLTKQ